MKSSSVEISKKLLPYLTTLLVVLLIVSFFPLGDSFLVTSSNDIIELNSNAYYKWHTFFTDEIHSRVAYLFILAAIGCCCWYRILGNSLSVFLLFFFLLSINGVTITGLSVLVASALLLLIHPLSLKRSIASLSLAAIFSIVVGLLCQQLSFWTVGIAVLFLVSRGIAVNKTWLAFGALSIICGLFFSNLAGSLDLPINAVFVPGYNYIYGVDPLIGPQPERVFINKLWVEERLSILAAITFIAWICTYTKPSRVVTFFLFIILVLESALMPDGINVIAPFSSLSRIVPNAMLFPVPLLVAGFLPAFFTLRFTGIQNLATKAVFFIGTLLFLLFLPPEKLFGSAVAPVTPSSHFFLTPSLYLSKNNLPLPPTKSFDVFPLTIDNTFVKASYNQEQVSQIFLNKSQSRWSTKPLSQSGNEWLEIHLATPMNNIVGIELSNPTFIGDYPRGIEVFAGMLQGQSCQSQSLVYKEPWWRGSVEQLSHDVRYLTTQNIVKLYFTQPAYPIPTTPISCFLIKQTGADPFYEWSVQTLKLFVSKEP